MSLKVAIVGCGKIADGHVEEIAKMPGRAQVVAVCDRELLMAEQLATRYRIPRHYDSLEKLLEAERPDVVHITTPPQSHLPLARVALAAGCHVYVEKPFALNLPDAQALLGHAESARKKVTVGYSSLFDPPAVMLRQLVEEGVLGEPLHVESFYGYDLSGPFGTALLSDGAHWVHKLPGKLLHNIIDHMLNKMVEYIPDDEPAVAAFGYVHRKVRFGDERDELLDELRLTLRGERCSGYGTFSSHIRPGGQFVRLYGTKNIAHMDLVARTVTFQEAPKLPSALGRLLPPFAQAAAQVRAGSQNLVRFFKSDFHFFAGLNTHLAEFYDCILTDGAPPVPYRDIVRIARIMDDVFTQLTAAQKRAAALPVAAKAARKEKRQ